MPEKLDFPLLLKISASRFGAEETLGAAGFTPNGSAPKGSKEAAGAGAGAMTAGALVGPNRSSRRFEDVGAGRGEASGELNAENPAAGGGGVMLADLLETERTGGTCGTGGGVGPAPPYMPPAVGWWNKVFTTSSSR